MAKIQKTMDGAQAAAYTAYAFTEVAGIYPITPSTALAENTDAWAAQGKQNMFGQTVNVIEMQSEGGAAGTVHGSLQSGALTTTYTASQGLLLMIPNMYKMAGQLLPAVLHITARSIATHALSIFGDHSDVMAARQTGFAFLFGSNVQEAMDLAAVAHLSAIQGRVPFGHVLDGFRTSHEIQKIDVLDYDDLRDLLDMDALNEFRKRGLNPTEPVLRGSAQNPDIFFQAREAANPYYNAVPAVVEENMNKINKLTGRDYRLFNYYGHTEATHVIVAMGSACETIAETVDYLMAKGEKVGVLNVRLFRPFSVAHFLKEMPKTVERISVLDKSKDPGAIGEPLYQDVCTVYFSEANRPLIVGGRYGLSSKDVTPAQILAVFENLKQPEPRNGFTVGIVDDVTNLSLEVGEEVDMTPDGNISVKIWGLGSDGTISANKNAIKIIGDSTDQYAQGYFSYDSKKAGGVTQSHLRFGKEKIRSPYLVKISNFIACHRANFLEKYDVLEGLKEGGTFLLNTNWSVEDLEEKLPGSVKRYLAKNKINFYIIDATKIAGEIGLGHRTNTVLQSAFFKLSNIIPIEDAIVEMKKAIESSYGKRGQKVIDMNNAAVDAGVNALTKIDVPADWANAPLEEAKEIEAPEHFKRINVPIDSMRGDSIPVSTFVGQEDGTFQQGTSKYEKRAIALEVPSWEKENCIQCNFCAYVCPHATIRPFLSTHEELENAPGSIFDTLKFNDRNVDYNFSILINQMDCVGCSVCADVCPGKAGKKALVMKPIDEEIHKFPAWEYAMTLSEKPNPANKYTPKGSQFEQPLLEYSGACAGCGETPYAKLVTQLYGDSMVIANATGCSSIWGSSAPSTPYTVNRQGRGPAWANSLFEDAAEFGFGIVLGNKKIKEGHMIKAKRLAEISGNEELNNAIENWMVTIEKTIESKVASKELVQLLETSSFTGEAEEIRLDLVKNKDSLAKISHWIFGGDGWAYDIGFSGLDHVISTGENINILIFDTEVYSNTGGQSSKSTPVGAIQKFASSGKSSGKKDLGMIAMSYGNVYVAQVGMGADYNQTIKALKEAEEYNGPSIVIAYSPCIEHGIKEGMGKSMSQIKAAVNSGYWHLYRYNPDLREQGKNPFQLDSKEPKISMEEFLDTENRYASLKRFFPERAEILYKEAADQAARKYAEYKRIADQEPLEV
ncbi:MAG: pyruvate:ferredoxin (flavodoxin) oxidoreductase [Defluviitaleaceae bacterium]|nr:pyruvate:ferredoxin (flavodoxin) oxidoreductase [Defluviitaleaceae bacterium]